MRPKFEEILSETGILAKLSEFRPVVIGTPPLGIALPSSDIDIACEATDLDRFYECATAEFEHMAAFNSRSYEIRQVPTVIVNFEFREWPIEIFCQTIPVEQQMGVRHFLVERRLLGLHPQLRSLVLQAKRGGLKTEPAFAQVLGLPGDPYEAMLSLDSLTDNELATLTIPS